MTHSSCPCCSDQRIWKAVEELLKPHCLEMEYCPVCGQSAGVREFLRNFHAQIIAAIPEMVLDENGNPMFQDRTPWSDPGTFTASTRISYEIDLDKIDISREMELLEKHQQKEKARKSDILADHIVRRLMEKYVDNNN